jgi:hypothetical protein
MNDDYANLARQAAELQLSQTLNRLAALAQGMPVDVHDKADTNAALCTTVVDLVRALDCGRIQFTRDEDCAMLHGLLLVALQIIFDGKFAQGVECARVQ